MGCTARVSILADGIQEVRYHQMLWLAYLCTTSASGGALLSHVVLASHKRCDSNMLCHMFESIWYKVATEMAPEERERFFFAEGGVLPMCHGLIVREDSQNH